MMNWWRCWIETGLLVRSRLLRPLFLVVLALMISGPAHSDAPAPADLSGFGPWMVQNTLPLITTDDFAPLLARCGAAQLVLLGDGSHGSDEFYRLRRLISLELMRCQRIDFVAIEADWLSCRKMDAYVREACDEYESAESLLRALPGWLAWVWQNQDMALFLEQLRALNLTRPPARKVAIYGMDLLDGRDSLHGLIGCPPYDRAARALETCLDWRGDPQDYLRHLAAGAPDCETAAQNLLQQVPASGLFPYWLEDRSFDRLQQALMAVGTEAYYRCQLLYGERGWNVRVRHFSRTLQRLLKRHGSASRGIVWAHNTHVGDATATPMPRWGLESLGQLLRRNCGAQGVFLLGQFSFQGSVRASRQWQGEVENLIVPPARDGSLEAVLHHSGVKAGMWLFTAAERRGGPNVSLDQRAIGVVYEPLRDQSENYLRVYPMERYDGLIFVDQTTAVRPLTPAPAEGGGR
ncbi:MAG: erythromycin esterase family protein [Desulfuromonadaceae bacterium]|nr:erythromycin esterase family protein [Desulfuromonadaceae bacterium]